MQHLEVSGAVRHIYMSFGSEGLKEISDSSRQKQQEGEDGKSRIGLPSPYSSSGGEKTFLFSSSFSFVRVLFNLFLFLFL